MSGQVPVSIRRLQASTASVKSVTRNAERSKKKSEDRKTGETGKRVPYGFSPRSSVKQIEISK